MQELSWDGDAWVVGHGCDESADCEQPKGVPDGVLDATITYSDSSSVTTALGLQDELIGPPLTLSKSYRHPADEVRFEIR